MQNIDSVGVTFNQPLFGSKLNPKTYWYKTNIKGIQPGDTVIIDSAGSGKMACATVVDIYRNTVLNQAVKWIVDKVDTESYKNAEMEHQKYQQRKFALQNQIDVVNQQLKHRESAIREDIVRKALIQDERYNTLVDSLQGFAQELRDLEEGR